MVILCGLSTMVAMIPSCSAAADSSNPATVAEEYAGLLARGELEKAALHVVVEQREMVKALALGGPDGPAQLTGELHVANIVSQDGRATATLVGRLCRVQPGVAAQPQCVENDDPHTVDPLFVLQLVETPGDSWQVVFGSEPFSEEAPSP